MVVDWRFACKTKNNNNNNNDNDNDDDDNNNKIQSGIHDKNIIL